MDNAPKPNKIKIIRPETLEFIILYNQLKGKAFSGNGQLAEALGFNSASSITEIIKSRQNIDVEKLKIFKEKYKESLKSYLTSSINSYQTLVFAVKICLSG